MLYQLWSCAVIISHGLLPCLFQRYTSGTGRLELLTATWNPNAKCGAEGVGTHMSTVPIVIKTGHFGQAARQANGHDQN